MAASTIVGAGHMGSAIAKALCANELHHVSLVDTDQSRLDRSQGRCARLGSSLTVLEEGGAVMLAISPQDFPSFAAACPVQREWEEVMLGLVENSCHGSAYADDARGRIGWSYEIVECRLLEPSA